MNKVAKTINSKFLYYLITIIYKRALDFVKCDNVIKYFMSALTQKIE
jgi:hypothetical protein